MKLLIWYNPFLNSFYTKQVKHSDYKEGNYNQFGHLLIQEFEFYNGNLKRGLSDLEYFKLRHKKNYDPYLKYYINREVNLFDKIYKM